METERENLQKCCRTCLASERITEPVDNLIGTKKISDLLQTLVTKLSFSESLPSQICSLCKQNLIVAFTFHSMVTQNELKLREVFEIREIDKFIDGSTQTEEEIVTKIEFKDIEEESKEIYEIVQDEQPEDEYLIEFEDDGDQQSDCLDEFIKIVNGFECKTCKKVFDKMSRLKRHEGVHNAKNRPFECTIIDCFQRFTSEKGLVRHQIIHTETMKRNITINQPQNFACEICGKEFDRQMSLAAHSRVHKGEDLECDICQKVFTSIQIFRKHKKTHGQAKSHTCNICEKSFALNFQLVNHMNAHFGVKPYKCDICSKVFGQSSTLKEHIRIHSKEKPFKCQECDKAFNNPSNLRQHVKRHSGVKPFECTNCPQKFVSKSALQSHILTHTGEKPFVCDVCGSGFSKSYSLKKHRRIHTGERPYECSNCGMKFICIDHLKRHERTHTGEKPYSCKYCERCFAQSNDLVKHLRFHIGDKTYSCSICNEGFRLHGELKKHLEEHYKRGETPATSTTKLEEEKEK